MLSVLSLRSTSRLFITAADGSSRLQPNGPKHGLMKPVVTLPPATLQSPPGTNSDTAADQVMA